MSLLSSLSEGLGIEPEYIESVSLTASKRYRTYQIPKRTGGLRTISHPAAELKALQRWIVDRILPKLPVHPAAAAYEPGSSVRKNAEIHVRSRYLLGIDFRDFFASILEKDVLLYLSRQVGVLPAWWQPEDSELLAALVCRNRRLTIGAVSSPSLSNRMCFQLDKQIADFCADNEVAFSRYADDLFFSAMRPNVLKRVESRVGAVIDYLDCPGGLQIKTQKTRHTSKKRRRIVTGLVLSSEGKVSIGRSRKRQLRSMIHQYENLEESERSWLRGYLAFCRDVEPAFVSRLYVKFGSSRIEEVTGDRSEA